MLRDGELALDVRTGDDFAAGHVPGSVNIALSGQFASWAGIVLGLTAHPVLIAETDSQLEEARAPSRSRWAGRAEWISGGRHCRLEASWVAT